MIDYFRISLKNMRKRKLRSWLTILGIVLGTVTIIALITLGAGMQKAVEKQVLSIAGSKIRVIPGSLQGPPIGRDDLTMDDVSEIESIIGVDYVMPILVNNAEVEYNRIKKFVGIAGYETKNIEMDDERVGVNLEVGTQLKDGDKKVVQLGHFVAKDFFDKEIGVGNNIIINGEKFKVIGITEKTGSQIIDNSIRMSLDYAQDYFDQKDIVGVITVQPEDGFSNDEIKEKIISRLKKSRSDENFEVFTAQNAIDQVNGILDIVNAVLIAIASISLFVGSLGIMNSMFTSVFERTGEIGVMKAIGARNRDIFGIIIVDSGIMGLIGGLFGAIFGFALAYMVVFVAKSAGFDLLMVSFEWVLIGETMFGTFLIGVISGLLPAIRAVRLNPVEALRYE